MGFNLNMKRSRSRNTHVVVPTRKFLIVSTSLSRAMVSPADHLRKWLVGSLMRCPNIRIQNSRVALFAVNMPDCSDGTSNPSRTRLTAAKIATTTGSEASRWTDLDSAVDDELK